MNNSQIKAKVKQLLTQPKKRC